MNATRTYYPLAAFLLILAALYAVFLVWPEYVPYVTVHGLAELFGILVACSVFVVAWDFGGQLRNTYLQFLGIGYLFAGGLHLLHLLAYRGMGVFGTDGANLATQLWMVGRCALCIAFVGAPLAARRRLRKVVVFGVWLAATTLVLLTIFRWRIFPACYIEANEPDPLTPFKKIGEVVIGAGFLAAIPLLYRRRADFDAGSLRLISGALMANVAAEATFLLYRTADDSINMVGHLLLIASAFLIYKALVEANLQKVRGASGPAPAEEGAGPAGSPRFDPWVLLTARVLGRVCSVLVIGIGVLVLAGWAFDIVGLRTLRATGVAVRPNAALCVLLAGISLWLLPGPRAGWGRRVGTWLAGLVAAVGGLTFIEHVTDWDLAIDHVLVRNLPLEPGALHPGRMGLPAAVAFTLLGAGLLLLDSGRPHRRLLSQGLTLLAMAVGLLPLIGYIYDVPSLYAAASHAGIAFFTAVAVVVLSMGMLLTRPQDGLMAVVTADRAGGVMARRLLVATILVPIVLGWVRLLGERHGHYESGFGVSVLVLSLIVIFSALIWRNAAMLNVLEAQRERARAERQRAERKLYEAGQRLRGHVENSPLAVVEWDSQLRITRWTGAAEHTFGWRAEEVLGRRVNEVLWTHPDDAAEINQLMREMLDGRQRETLSISRNYRKDGSVVHCRWHNSALLDDRGRMTSVLSLGEDITARKQAEEEVRRLTETLERRVAERTMQLQAANASLQAEIGERKRAEAELYRVNKALHILTECNQILVRATDESHLLRSICRVAVEFGGYDVAWVGQAGPEEPGTVQPLAWAGCEEDGLAALRMTCAGADFGRGPTGRAIRTGTPAVLRNLAESPEFEPWRAEAIARGWTAAISMPLVVDGRIFGAMTLYSTDPAAFGDAEVRLLQELADDLAFGIASVRLRVERQRMLEALQASEERYRRIVETAEEGICVLDEVGGTVFVNQKMAQMLGYTADEMLGSPILSYVDPRDRAAVESALNRRRAGVRERYDVRFRRRDGSELWAILASTPIFDETGRYKGSLKMATDITERKRLERGIAEISSLEQQRIGRELHDALGQNITGISFLSKILEQKLHSLSLPEAQEAAEIGRLAALTNKQARSLARGLSPVDLTAGNFEARIHELAAGVQEIFSVSCACECDSRVRIPDDDAALHLYRIAQEAVSNGIKHGRARNILIQLIEQNGQGMLIVQDDGRGMPEETERHDGMGLQIMRYRASAIGGQLRIRSNAGRGTVVICAFGGAGS